MNAPPERKSRPGGGGSDLSIGGNHWSKYSSYLQFARPADDPASLRIAWGRWAPKEGDPLQFAIYVADPDGDFGLKPLAVFDQADAACNAAEWLGCAMDPNRVAAQRSGGL